MIVNIVICLKPHVKTGEHHIHIQDHLMPRGGQFTSICMPEYSLMSNLKHKHGYNSLFVSYILHFFFFFLLFWINILDTHRTQSNHSHALVTWLLTTPDHLICTLFILYKNEAFIKAVSHSELLLIRALALPSVLIGLKGMYIQNIYWFYLYIYISVHARWWRCS